MRGALSTAARRSAVRCGVHRRDAAPRCVSLLRESEDIAPISFEPGEACPWRVALDMGIWRFQVIAELSDYLDYVERKDALAS